jgi:DHA1 family inner membrane transport protein
MPTSRPWAARGSSPGLFEGVLFVVVAASLSNRAAAERAWGVIILVSGVIDCALLVGAYAMPQDFVASGCSSSSPPRSR